MCVLFGLLDVHTGSIVFSLRSLLIVSSPDSALLAPPMIPLTRRLFLQRLPIYRFRVKISLKIYSVKRQRAKKRDVECFLFESVFGVPGRQSRRPK